MRCRGFLEGYFERARKKSERNFIEAKLIKIQELQLEVGQLVRVEIQVLVGLVLHCLLYRSLEACSFRLALFRDSF